jgi:hypothetical protein
MTITITITSKSKSKSTTTGGGTWALPLTPTPLPTLAILNRTEAWGEGAPLTAQAESMRMAGSSRHISWTLVHPAGWN